MFRAKFSKKPGPECPRSSGGAQHEIIGKQRCYGQSDDRGSHEEAEERMGLVGARRRE